MTNGLTRRRLLRTMSTALAGGLLTHSRASARQDARVDYDVCIIGSGFAGTYLGLRLVEQGIRTVIVEAGPRLSASDNADGRTSIFPWASTGDQAFPLDDTRTIAVGGTSRKWNGVINRLRPSDVRMRSTFGLDVDWPLAYDDLVPYYCQAEQAMYVRGGPYVPGAEPVRCKYPVESAAYVGPSSRFPAHDLAFFPLAFALRADGRPLRLDEEPLAKFEAAPGAKLLAEHAVTELVTDERGTVSVVRARRADDSLAEIRARHVVVAAGVGETARLLLASRSRAFPDGIGNGRGLVGRHFNAHPRYRMNLAPRDGLLRPDGKHRSYTPGDAARRAGASAFHVDVHLGTVPLVDVTLEMEPAAAARMSLDGARRDRWGRPELLLRADWSARDGQTRARSLALARELVLALGEEKAPEPALRWFHPAGVCRMARDEREGVVDADGRVFGTPNLYLAGASVFPTSGSTNATLTIVALALRLGDHLARIVRSRDARG